jgi:hypothetical protein
MKNSKLIELLNLLFLNLKKKIYEQYKASHLQSHI